MERIAKFHLGALFLALAIAVMLFFLHLWWSLSTPVKEVDSEVVNGILTVSGIIFGFQFAVFRPTKWIDRIAMIGILLLEVTALGVVGTVYVKDVLYGAITTNTLLAVFLAFAYVLLSTVMFAVLDFFFFSK